MITVLLYQFNYNAIPFIIVKCDKNAIITISVIWNVLLYTINYKHVSSAHNYVYMNIRQLSDNIEHNGLKLYNLIT